MGSGTAGQFRLKYFSQYSEIFSKYFSRSLPSCRSSRGSLYNWEKTFKTDDKEEVETVLASLGYQVEWRSGELDYSLLVRLTVLCC